MSFDLKYRERPATGPSSEKPEGLILFHGYGSNELDMFGLADHLDPSLHVVCVRSPISVSFNGFAWYELSRNEHGFVQNIPQAIEAREVIAEFIAAAPEKFGIRAPVSIGGFSQGAIMSLGVTLWRPGLVSRLVMMSGAVLPVFVPERDAISLVGIKALVQHGTRDEVLPYEGSREAASLLRGLGADVTHEEYSMGHSISDASLRALNDWLRL